MNVKWLAKEYLSHIKTQIRDIVPDLILKRNNQFKNLHQGQRCFILGSGNSINGQDLTQLAGEIVMTQNHFHAHEQIKIINPTYHVNVPKYQPKEYDNDWRIWLTSMDTRLPKKTVIFFGKNTKYLVDEMGLFQMRAYYMKHGYTSAVVKRPPIDITYSIMAVPTVLTQCLAIAIYMGFKEIYLLGFDLDQIYQTQKNREKVRFYGLSPITANQAEIEIEERSGASGLDWASMWVIWEQCNLLKNEAERRGIKIINATNGGFLNMFERQDYQNIV
jgi:hypothetical protein